VKKRKKDERGKKRPKRRTFFFSFSESNLYKNTLLEYEEDEGEEHYYCDSFYRERAERL